MSFERVENKERASSKTEKYLMICIDFLLLYISFDLSIFVKHNRNYLRCVIIMLIAINIYL